MGPVMPILHELDRRLDSPPFDREEFDRRLPVSQAVADRVPLVHVHSEMDGFEELLKIRPHQLRVTKDGVATRGAELLLDLERSVYFYAGRVFPNGRGVLALGFASGIENGGAGSVTPFDTGGLVAGHLKLNLEPHNNDPARLAYGKSSVLPLTSWRNELARVLAAYFDQDSDYWNSRPSRSDPERVYELNNDWRAWTFEIRFHEGPSVYDCAAWSCNEPMFERLRKIDDKLPLNDEIQQHWSVFWSDSRRLDTNGSQWFREVMESWIRKQVGL